MKDVQGILDMIYRAENGGRIDYNVVYGGIRAADRPKKPITQMTVREVLDWQHRIGPKYQSEAAGAVQIMPDTLKGMVKAGVVGLDDTFDASTQDRITVGLMRRRGLDKWLNGTMSTTDFGTSLAREWASLPVLGDTWRNGKPIARGQAYYGGVGANTSRAFVSPAAMEAALGAPGNRQISLAAYAPTGRPGSMIDNAGAALAPDMRARMAGQFTENVGDPYRHMKPWEAAQVDLNPGRSHVPGVNAGGAGGAALGDFPDIRQTDYQGISTGGSGPVVQGWNQAFMDSASDSFIVRRLQSDALASRYRFDMGFDPVAQAQADGLTAQYRFLGAARNRAHYDALKNQLELEGIRQQRMAAWDGFGAHMLGGFLNPDSLVMMALPVGEVGALGLKGFAAGAFEGGVKTALYIGAGEAAIESGRSRYDPYSTQLDSAMRIGGATIMAGILGGTIGAFAGMSARRGLADDLANEIARRKGVGKTTNTVDLGRGRKGVVRADPEPPAPGSDAHLGVRIVGDEVLVDEATIVRRFKDGTHATDARTPNELMEYEITRAASIKRRLADFAKSEKGSVDFATGAKRTQFAHLDSEGNVQIDMEGIATARQKDGIITLGPARGSPAEARITPVRIKARSFESDQLAADFILKAHKAAALARDSGEFRNNIAGMLDGTVKAGKGLNDLEANTDAATRQAAERKAETDATDALETYRRENNRILQDARIQALSILPDSPYKRIHRNAMAPETRDLVDKLAADGGFLRGSDETGLGPGPSVYSRARTWDGLVRRLWDRQNELYDKYLGITRTRVADVAAPDAIARKKSPVVNPITRDAFSRRATQSYIAGEKDAIPEVMEMAETIRSAYREFSDAAEMYGIITTRDTLAKKADNLREQIDAMPEGAPREAVQARLDKVQGWMKDARREPKEDYFTRVWSNRAIRDNREAFRDRIVIPWMRENPFVEVWQIGRKELKKRLAEMEGAGIDRQHPRYLALSNRVDEAPETSRWQRVRTSDQPHDLNARAEKMIDTILQEGEPADLTTMRDPNRPTFGRHRQFNIPNARLLKAGGKGNRIADFIETDPALVMKIYAERMGPAIEMGRTFASPAKGMDWQDGFRVAMERARRAEEIRFEKAHGNQKFFPDHWAPIERDMLHLKDRVTNRVIRDPNRWDNRAATALRNWSNLAFMGTSALPAITELGALVMRHGLSRVFQQAFGELDQAAKIAQGLGMEEMRKAGAIMEVVQGAALSRFAETGMDAIHGTAPERWLRTASNKYFLWNGLAPLSTRLKELDAGIRVHDMLERIDQVAMLGNGADKADLAELNRWGITRAHAEAIAREPIEQTSSGHWVANTDAWGNENLVRTFRAAIAQGNENAILMATAADKPIVMDGTIYLRAGGRVDKYAHIAGLRKVGDFWQVQSGLMSLPFQFWNYAIAAHNKILLAGLDEPSAQKLGGIAAMVGLGFLVASVRTPDWKWNKMNASGKLMEAIDQSGVSGVIGQMRGLFESPSRIPGAGPNVLANAVGGIAGGDPGELSWALPYRNHLLLRDFFDGVVNRIERRQSGMDLAA